MAGPALDADDTQPLDMETPLTNIFNLEMPVEPDSDGSDGGDIPPTQPDNDDAGDHKDPEPSKASERGWET